MHSGMFVRKANTYRPAYVAAIVALCPCIALAQSGSAGGRSTCSANGARFAVGELFTLDLAERARRAASAQEVRKIEPGGAYTMELNPDRLNIEVDQAGTVRGLKCG
jgi:hypothetical protein